MSQKQNSISSCFSCVKDTSNILFVLFFVCFFFWRNCAGKAKGQIRGQEGLVSLSYLFLNFVGHHPETKRRRKVYCGKNYARGNDPSTRYVLLPASEFQVRFWIRRDMWVEFLGSILISERMLSRSYALSSEQKQLLNCSALVVIVPN